MVEKYSWTNFYKELAYKLLDYKCNRTELVSLVKSVYEDTDIHMAKVEKDGSLIDIDPFTFFGLFNKQIAKEKRATLVTEFGKRMNVAAATPENYDGLPVLNNQNAAFFMFSADRGEKDIDYLWELFDYALRYANNPSNENKELFSKYFDICINLKHNGNAKITMALFWIAPDVFINLDSRNEWFIYQSDRLPAEFVSTLPKISVKMPATLYFELLGKIKEFIKTTSQFENFIDLSNEAWKYSNEINKKLKEDDFWPSVKEYDPKISKDAWKNFINKVEINHFSPMSMLVRMLKLDGQASCKQLSEEFGESPNFYNSCVMNMGRRAKKYFNMPGCMDKEEERLFVFAFQGKQMETQYGEHYVYRMRPELKAALEEMNLSEFDFPSVSSTDEINYWLYEPGHKAANLDEVYSKNIMQLSCIELGDLIQYKTKNQIKAVLEKSKTFKGSIANVSAQSFEFSRVMNPGDIIYVRIGNNKILARGIVQSDYYFDGDANYPHKRRVHWTNRGDWTFSIDVAIIKELTLIDKKKHENYPTKLEQLFEESDNHMNEKFNKNIILYGPPGTGKTYNTINYAVAIIEGKSIEEVQNEGYGTVKKRYEKYLAEKQIQFTTFHQSYGYEDFIEGIKPVVGEDEDAISYKRVDGIFKKFCDDSRIKEIDRQKYELNNNPDVWKVSLEGTRDNQTREECMKNNHIRIGWDSYGEKLSDLTNYEEGGKIVLNSFMSRMKIGDIVLSCYTASTIDAIGIIAGDPEWHPEYEKYRRVRKVNWIVKGIKEDIVDINNRSTMTLSSVYRMNVKVADVMAIIDKYNPTKKHNNHGKRYVFIIDEINRGNISKIFGELITLVEESKREGNPEQLSAILPYSQEEFTIPNNVYILGTMNTADRSIALMDTALRRRFDFIEMMPRTDVLEGVEVEGVNISEILHTINERITLLYDREHTIGHAFFMPLKKESTVEKLAEIFESKLIPLLQEYFYEDYEKIQLVLGDNGKDEQYKFIKDIKVELKNVFKKSSAIDLELPEVKYEINKDALLHIESYKEII